MRLGWAMDFTPELHNPRKYMQLPEAFNLYYGNSRSCSSAIHQICQVLCALELTDGIEFCLYVNDKLLMNPI